LPPSGLFEKLSRIFGHIHTATQYNNATPLGFIFNAILFSTIISTLRIWIMKILDNLFHQKQHYYKSNLTVIQKPQMVKLLQIQFDSNKTPAG